MCKKLSDSTGQTVYNNMVLCELSYQKENDIKKWLQIFSALKDQNKIFHSKYDKHLNYLLNSSSIISDGKDLMFWFRKDEELFFVFSGTRGPLGWESNLKLKKSTLMGGTTIHQGFYDSWVNGFKPTVKLILEYYMLGEYKVDAGGYECIRRINCIGHSRGGALATLCARDIVKNRLIPVDIVHVDVFGCPRIGNNDFVQEFKNLGFTSNYNQYCNGYDPTPEVPLYDMGYEDTISRYGKMYHWLKVPFWHQLPIVNIFDHKPKNYVKQIFKYYENK